MKTSIYLSFVFLIAYAISVLFGYIQAALFFFSISPIVVLHMVFKILRDPQEVKVSFDDEFYQDGSHPRIKND